MKFNLNFSQKLANVPSGARGTRSLDDKVKPGVKTDIKPTTSLEHAINLQRNSLVISAEQTKINLHVLKTRKKCNAISSSQTKLVSSYERLGSSLFAHRTLTESEPGLHSPNSQSGFSIHLSSLEKKIVTLSNHIEGQLLDLSAANADLIAHAPFSDEK